MAYPNLITLADCGGDPGQHLETVYQAYMDELVHAGLTFQGKALSFRFMPQTNGRGYAFWHAISEAGETAAEDDRIIDLRRCERITWPAYMLATATNDGNGDVLWWRTTRRGRSRIVFWIKAESYALVMEEREDYWLFLTTYTVRSGRSRQFAAEHAAYWATQAL